LIDDLMKNMRNPIVRLLMKRGLNLWSLNVTSYDHDVDIGLHAEVPAEAQR